MDARERRWLFLLVGIFLVFNVVTLSPAIPWQNWLLWSDPTPDQSVAIEFGDYEIRLPAEGIDREPSGRELDKLRELAAELVRRQLPDGSWSNTFTDAREDDPLVATPWAAAALAICRRWVGTATDAPAPSCSGRGTEDEHPSGPQ